LCAIGDLILGDDSEYCFLCDGSDSGGGGGGDDNPDLPLCFSKVATVQVQGVAAPVSMEELKVGDSVLTGTGRYEPVYAFGHKNTAQVAEFLQMEMSESKQKLELTAAHMVFVQGQKHPIRADSIQVGDVLRSTTAEGGKVTKIGTVTRTGLYAPLTPSGSVVVDGIVASSYISLQSSAMEYVELKGGISTGMSQQDYVHMGLSPLRLVCMGISSRLCAETKNNEYGMPYYAAFAVQVNQWAHSQNIFVQTLVLLAVPILTGICLLLENTFGPSWAPLAVLLIGVVYGMVKKTGRKIKSV
jgi:hypothetical protein